MMPTKVPKVTTRKWGGDDLYSWAVLADGRPIVTGLSKTEAAYHKAKVVEMYRERADRGL